MESQTKAQGIAAAFGNDGTCWKVGESLFEVLRLAGAECTTRGPYFERWELPDGSALLITPAWWDLEAPGEPWVCAGAPEEGEVGV
jgi:hypothetical protein